jgi:hypothetical protein
MLLKFQTFDDVDAVPETEFGCNASVIISSSWTGVDVLVSNSFLDYVFWTDSTLTTVARALEQLRRLHYRYRKNGENVQYRTKC